MPDRIPEPAYPAEARIRRVRSNGEIRWKGGLIYVSSVLVNDLVALIETGEGGFEVRFYDKPLGRIARGGPRNSTL